MPRLRFQQMRRKHACGPTHNATIIKSFLPPHLMAIPPGRLMSLAYGLNFGYPVTNRFEAWNGKRCLRKLASS